jgi:CheY-like chemotaxis protein
MADDKYADNFFGHQKRVLIVDDDKNLLKFIRAALESEVYQC